MGQHSESTADSILARQHAARIEWRHRFRLHKLSWLALILATAGMLIIIVPGSPRSSVEWERQPLFDSHGSAMSWSDYDFRNVTIWSHGWPLEYLRRPFGSKGFLIEHDGRPVMWSSLHSWPTWGKVYAFSLPALLANILIGAVIVISFVVTCESWIRRRGRFRFSLLDAIVASTIVGLVFGWWQYHARTQAVEQAIRVSMIARGSLTDLSKRGPRWATVVAEYHGPDWLQRLVGNSLLVPFCLHIDQLNLDSRLLTQEDYADLSKLPYVEKVHVVGRLTPELVDSLAALPRLRTLNGEILAYGGDGLPRPEPMISSSNVSLLDRLPKLTTLKLGRTETSPADLQVVAQLPRLETVQLSGLQFLVEDLEKLASCPSLETMHVQISATESEMSNFVAAHPGLHIDWVRPKPPEVTGFTSIPPWTEPWHVASVVFKRWHAEDGVDATSLDPEHFDFRRIRFTKERLQRLSGFDLSEVKGVYLGAVDSAETAMDLIARCGDLEEFEARYVTLSAQDLKALRTKVQCQLYLQHGSLTEDDFRKLIQRAQPSMLSIFNSTFSNAEAQRIANASQNTSVEIYKGFNEELSESVFEFEVDDDPDSPFRGLE
jgi:hypothetical protein